MEDDRPETMALGYVVHNPGTEWFQILGANSQRIAIIFSNDAVNDYIYDASEDGSSNVRIGVAVLNIPFVLRGADMLDLIRRTWSVHDPNMNANITVIEIVQIP